MLGRLHTLPVLPVTGLCSAQFTDHTVTAFKIKTVIKKISLSFCWSVIWSRPYESLLVIREHMEKVNLGVGAVQRLHIKYMLFENKL